MTIAARRRRRILRQQRRRRELEEHDAANFRIGYVDPFFVHPAIRIYYSSLARKRGQARGENSTPPTRVSRAAATAQEPGYSYGGLPTIRANIEGMAMDVWTRLRDFRRHHGR